MPNRLVILTVIASALLLGVMVSGCNRDKGTAAVRPQHRRVYSDNRKRGVRPAEVLAAQAYRPRQRQYSYSRQAPRPRQAFRSRTASSSYVGPVYTNPSMASANIPVYVPSASSSMMPVYHSPELTMAMASLPTPGYRAPQPAAVVSAPVVSAPVVTRMPMPELGPVRYHRILVNPGKRQVSRVMISTGNFTDRQEIQRALEPLVPAYSPVESAGIQVASRTRTRVAAMSSAVAGF